MKNLIDADAYCFENMCKMHVKIFHQRTFNKIIIKKIKIKSNISQHLFHVVHLILKGNENSLWIVFNRVLRVVLLCKINFNIFASITNRCRLHVLQCTIFFDYQPKLHPAFYDFISKLIWKNLYDYKTLLKAG